MERCNGHYSLIVKFIIVKAGETHALCCYLGCAAIIIMKCGCAHTHTHTREKQRLFLLRLFGLNEGVTAVFVVTNRPLYATMQNTLFSVKFALEKHM